MPGWIRQSYPYVPAVVKVSLNDGGALEFGGAVNTSTTPQVQYAYTEMVGGVNNSRLVSMIYPNGRVLTYNYNAGVDNSISRLSSISSRPADRILRGVVCCSRIT